MTSLVTGNTSSVDLEEDTSSIILETAKSIIILIFILLGIVLNLLLVVAVCRETKLHRPSFFFLLNLSSAELVRSGLCLPFYFIALVSSTSISEDNQFCKSASFFYTLLAYETIFTLLSLSLARYSIIAHQNFHKKKLTKFVCLTVISMTWTLAVIMAIPPIFRAGIPNQTASSDDANPAESLDRVESSEAHEEAATSFQNTMKDLPLNVPPPPIHLPMHHHFGWSSGLDQLGPCAFAEDNYYQRTDTLGFTIVFTIVLTGIHLIYLRIFIFMRQHRKMNPTRRAPAISDNWTFFGPGAAPLISSSVSSHFQSAIVQGVSTVTASAVTVPPSSALTTTAASLQFSSRGGIPIRANSGAPVTLGGGVGVARGTSGGVAGVVTVSGADADADAINAREAVEGYNMEEKITKTTYILTCAISLLWSPYILVVFVSVFNSEPTTDTALFLTTFLTFFQSAVTPLVCLLMLPPMLDLACGILKTLKCRRRRRRPNRSLSNQSGSGTSGANNNPIYENLAEMKCSPV